MPIDYSKGKIYRIYSPSHPDAGEYIGSTTQPLCRRIAGHRGSYKMYMGGKHNFITSFHILKYEDAIIELVKECPCENKEQLLREEGEYIMGTGGAVNRLIPGRTPNEHYEKHNKYREEHKEVLLEKQKKYAEEHKEAIAEYKKKYYEEHKEVLIAKQNKYYEEHKEATAKRGKKYRVEHTEEIAEKKKKYRDEHKEAIAEKKKKYAEEHKEEIAEKKRRAYQLKKERERFTDEEKLRMLDE